MRTFTKLIALLLATSLLAACRPTPTATLPAAGAVLRPSPAQPLEHPQAGHAAAAADRYTHPAAS